MSDNLYDQFEEWRVSERDAGTGQTDSETVTSDVQDDGAVVEQVSRDLFGFTVIPESGDEQEETESAAGPGIVSADGVEGEKPKTPFADLRQGRRVPRLKKTMVLALIAGGTFVFLFVINLFLHKKDQEKQYFDEQISIVEAGNDFSIGDLLRRSISEENEDLQTMENAGYYLQTPPSYEPVPAYRAVSVSPGAGTAPPAGNGAGGYYSDSDLLAMRAQIGKEGGYGFFAQAAIYDINMQPGLGGQIPTREEYTRQRIDELARLTQVTGGDRRLNADRANNGRYSDAGMYSQNNTQAGTNIQYLNDNCLFPGTIIHAILVSRIDTDYPGPIHARVTENVYDSMTGKNLLIPQGTILQGNYSSSSIGVAKVQVAWESMVVNYSEVAYQVSLGGMAGVDKRGRAGIAGTLDDHYFEWLKAAGIISLFSMLNSEVSYQTQGQTNPQMRELMDTNREIVNRLGDRLMERALNIQPTVRVANGTAVSVTVNAPLTLRPFPAIQAEGKYIRR